MNIKFEPTDTQTDAITWYKAQPEHDAGEQNDEDLLATKLGDILDSWVAAQNTQRKFAVTKAVELGLVTPTEADAKMAEVRAEEERRRVAKKAEEAAKIADAAAEAAKEIKID